MRNNIMSKKIIGLVLVATMLTPTLAFAEPSRTSTLMITTPINRTADLTKTETVFTTLNLDGSVKSTSITSSIHSNTAVAEIKDKSNLDNIKNLKGNDVPKKDGDSLIWKSNNGDVLYSGTTKKELPIGVKITYYLDDKEIPAKNLAGKSGKIKIKIEFKNNNKKIVNINGKARTVYESIPVSTVINFPVDNFSKVVANDGTLVKIGNNNVATFISVPGFFDSLGLKNGQLGVTLAETIVVTAEAKNFKLSPIYFMAAPELLDLDNIAGGPNVIGGIAAKLNEAKTKLPQLNDGVNQLDGGLGTLKSSVGELNTGLQSKLVPGAAKLAGGVKAVDDGVQKLAPGAAGVAGGVKAVDDGVQKLAGGSAKLVQGVEKLDEGINTTKKDANGMPLGLVSATSVLVSGVHDINAAINGGTLSDGTQTPAGGLFGGITKLKDGFVGSPNPSLLNPTLTDAINALYKLLQLNGGIIERKLIAGIKAQTVSSGDPNKPTFYDGIMAMYNGLSLLSKKTAPAVASADKFKAGVVGLGAQVHSQLLPGTQQLNEGISKLSANTPKLLDGAQQVNGGLAKLSANTPALSTGAQELNGGIALVASGINDKMVPGIDKLKSGSSQIAAGVNPLLSKVTPLMTNVEEVLAAKNEMVKIAKENSSFSGIDSSMEGSLKFLMQTGAIKQEDGKETKKNSDPDTNKSLWDKIKKLF